MRHAPFRLIFALALAIAGGASGRAATATEAETAPAASEAAASAKPEAAAAPVPAAARTVVAKPAASKSAAPKPALAPAAAPDPAIEARKAVGAFYAGKPDPVWLAPHSDAAAALVQALEKAVGHGLPPKRYQVEDLRRRLEGLSKLSASGRTALERDLAFAFLVYARDMTAGVLEPKATDPDVHLTPRRIAHAAFLQQAAAAPDMGAYLAALEPRSAEYERLRGLLSDFLRRATMGGWGAPVESGPLRPGDASPAVAELRRRLIALGDLAPEPEMALASADPMGIAPEPPPFYDDRLAQAVARFQDRHGLTPDGVAGPRTLRAINEPIERRITQIMLNLERMRWRGNGAPPRRLVVNQAGFDLTVYDGDKPIFKSRVAVGQEQNQTPEFDDKIDHLVFNPTWNVPFSIATKEILPILRQNPGYLAENNMSLLRGGALVDPVSVDWAKVTPGGFPYLIRQEPGLANALGRVKFMFPNNFNVYLHDTPSRGLFARASRAFSHGCVRVERPFELARLLLSAQTPDPEGEIQALLMDGRERVVPLAQPLPVNLVYHTAWVDESGVAQFRDDVYGRDERLAQALQARIP